MHQSPSGRTPNGELVHQSPFGCTGGAPWHVVSRGGRDGMGGVRRELGGLGSREPAPQVAIGSGLDPHRGGGPAARVRPSPGAALAAFPDAPRGAEPPPGGGPLPPAGGRRSRAGGGPPSPAGSHGIGGRGGARRAGLRGAGCRQAHRLLGDRVYRRDLPGRLRRRRGAAAAGRSDRAPRPGAHVPVPQGGAHAVGRGGRRDPGLPLQNGGRPAGAPDADPASP